MALFEEGLPAEASCLTSGNHNLPMKCQIQLSMIDVSKTFESLQNNLPHFRNITTLQLDNDAGKRSPSERGSQERYGSHYLPFTKNITMDGNFKSSTITQEDNNARNNQEPHLTFDAATTMVQPSKLSRIVARNYDINRTTPTTIYDGIKKGTGNSFNFLDLPREIRDLIYHSALVNRTGGRLILATTAKAKEDDWSISEDFAPNINLMCTCKQVKTEAQSIFYRNNTFVVRNCVSASVPECFPEPSLALLKSVELQFTIAHYHFLCPNLASQSVCAESPFFDTTFRLYYGHSKELMECWSTKAQLITKLPSLQDLIINVADPALQYYSKTAQLWIISLSLAQLRKRQEKGFGHCRIHVTGLLLEYFDWFLQASRLNKPQEKFYAKRNELNSSNI